MMGSRAQTDENAEVRSVELTAGEIWSLMMQYKDRDLGAAEQKLAEAYKALTGKEPW